MVNDADKLGKHLVSKVEDEFRKQHGQWRGKIIMQKHAIAILKYIRDNQIDDSLVTKEAIAKHMYEDQVCSRVTTMKILKDLEQVHAIQNKKERENTFSKMIINPTFNFGDVELEVLKSRIEEVRQHFEDIGDQTRKVNTVLVGELLKDIKSFSTQVYETAPKQRK